MASWVRPVARFLSQLEEQWAASRTTVLMVGGGLLVVSTLLLGSYIYFQVVVHPRKVREAEEWKKQSALLSQQMKATDEMVARARLEWIECQKHHPSMHQGSACPEPLDSYSYAVPSH